MDGDSDGTTGRLVRGASLPAALLRGRLGDVPSARAEVVGASGLAVAIAATVAEPRYRATA
jgi:hypothetical protein